MPKPNYSFEKRKRDLAKKAKKEEKKRRKLEGKPDTDAESTTGEQAPPAAAAE